MNKKSVTRAILENIGAGGPFPEKEPPVDMVTPPVAPDANMTIKDQAPPPGEEPMLNEPGEMPSEPGGVDVERASAKAVEAGLHPIENVEGLDLYTLYDGAKHEFEHTPDFDLAVAIAAHHVAKDPRYYDFLERMEDEMRRDKQSREPGVGPDEADREVGKGKRGPYHSMDVHDGEGEDDGW